MAQQPELLADINAAQAQSGVEYGLARLGSTWVFRGKSAAAGEELFTCTAPSYAVALLRDVNPGRAGSSPEHLTVAGSRLFFFADDGVHGLELWSSDGTTAGTALVADIRPGPNPGIVIVTSASRWQRSAARCSSSPTMGCAAPSCGRATAPPRVRLS